MKTKNIFKIIAATALCGAMAFAFAACGPGNDEGNKGNQGNEGNKNYYPDTETEVLEGLTKSKDGSQKTYYVYTAAGLRSFAEIISSENGDIGADTFGEATVELKADINLAGEDWVPASIDRMGANGMIIDGKNHVISNMTIASMKSAGFIGTIDGDITIKNLTFENAVVNCTAWGGVVVGYQLGVALFENVTVRNSFVDGDFGGNDFDNYGGTGNYPTRLGGIIGLCKTDDAKTETTLSGCTVTGTRITGYHNVSGLVGTAASWGMYIARIVLKNCTSSNNTIRVQGKPSQNVGEDGSSIYGSAFFSDGDPRATFEVTEQWILDYYNNKDNFPDGGLVAENNTFVWNWGVEEAPSEPEAE